MPRFRVIKAHDGIPEGVERLLPDSSVTRYMVENGYWEKVKEKKTRKSTGKKQGK